jgi:hypothetical protein
MHTLFIILLVQFALILIALTTLKPALFDRCKRLYQAWIVVSLWPFVLWALVTEYLDQQSQIKQAHTRR